MDRTTWKDYTQIAAAIATIAAVFVAAFAIWQSARTYEEQTLLQSNQAAHNATQAHLQLRVEHSEIIRLEDQIRAAGNSLDSLDHAEYNLYVAVAEDGIAMAEYVYKLWRGDPGWEDTVESWIVTYQPYLLQRKLDCGDWDQDFVRFIGKSLGTSSEHVCYDRP